MPACTPSLSQVIADKFIRTGFIYEYTKNVRLEYKKRGLAMIEVLEKYLPDWVSFCNTHVETIQKGISLVADAIREVRG